jgi:hypothetical protein
VTADITVTAGFAVGTPTRVSIRAGATVVNYGRSTQLSGVLYSGDTPNEVHMGGQVVTVQTASSAKGPWADLQTLTTSSVAGSEGTCTVTVTPRRATYYRVRFVAGAGSDYGDSLSFVVRVGVRPVLGTPKAPTSVRARQVFTVSGTLTPRFPAGQKTVRIKIYYYKHRRWVFSRQVSATNANSGSTTRYSVKVKLSTKGKYRFLAYTVPTVIWAGVTTPLGRVLTVR